MYVFVVSPKVPSLVLVNAKLLRIFKKNICSYITLCYYAKKVEECSRKTLCFYAKKVEEYSRKTFAHTSHCISMQRKLKNIYSNIPRRKILKRQ